ncbi:MAG: heparinase II/III family protein [Desulfobulbaceae bacterium]|nr:heparinase II/III family protein [Desulfobulbaceae bacterium]
MIDQEYSLIDWHLDIRYGFRWKASCWSRLIQAGRPAGVDIKLPWEITRMQHLPMLALIELGSAEAKELAGSAGAKEFQNQVLDFISFNPPRYGVNWRTPMDVGIRAANWVLTHSIYVAAGNRFSQEFEKVLSASLYDHGRHIIEFMEWDPLWRANHYLANLCGMVFICAALPADKDVDAWLAFAVQELVIEVQRQLQPDGSVFEASTGYHRLSVEMAVYATAVVLGIISREGAARLNNSNPAKVKFPKPLAGGGPKLYPLPGATHIMTPFSEGYFRRLQRGAAFARAVTKPSGSVALLGDNDSGRFFRLQPILDIMPWHEVVARYENLEGLAEPDFADSYPFENQLDFSPLVDAISGIVPVESTAESGSPGIDCLVVQALAAGLSAQLSSATLGGHQKEAGGSPEKLPSHAKVLTIPLAEAGVLEGLCLEEFPDFGLYVYRAPRFFLSIKCGAIGQDGYGGHAHNDQLAVELNIDGKNIITDPGVYRYTVDLLERQAYRSVKVHFAPQVADLEPGNMNLGSWRLGNEAQAQVDYLGQRCFEGSHVGYGKRVHRRVVIQEENIIIADWGDDGLEPEDPAAVFKRLDENGCLIPFCPGYGIRYRVS